MAQQHERRRAPLRAGEIAEYLGGLGFPCSKDDILRLVTGQGAPREIVAALERLPDELYSSLDDIMRHFKPIVR